MSILTTKWFWIFLLPFILLAVLYMTGKKFVHHEISIAAPPEVVWTALTDTDLYPEWNTVMLAAEGDLAPGNRIKYTFQQDNDTQMEIAATVKQLIPNKLLNQTGGLTGVITFDHRYELQPTSSGTKVIIHEDYRGVYVPFWNPTPVQDAYKRLNEALQKRAVSIGNG